MDGIEKIMLVDDNPIDQQIYKRCLQRSGLFEDVVCCGNGVEAMARLTDPEEDHPDLILLDLNMPVMNGFEFLDVLPRSLGSICPPVVVMLTTSLTQRDMARVQQHDFVRDFLPKPLTQAHLDRLVRMMWPSVSPAAMADASSKNTARV